MRAIVITATLLLCATSSHARIACQTAKPHGARDWWAWREIDYRACWYRGHPGVAKTALYWPVVTTPRHPRQAQPVPAVPIATTPPTFSERWPR